MSTTEVGSTTGVMAESKPVPAAKAGWPLWKKLTIVAVALIVAIALGVGLGVGLTRNNGDDSDDGDSSNGGDNSGNNNDNNNTGIWQPEVGASWQIILKYPIKLEDNNSTDGLAPNVSIWDLDVYDNDITIFQALAAADKRIICYFSAGSWEDWRDDAGDFDKADLGKGLDGWAGEKWLNVSSPAVRNIMKKRIKYAADKGCHAIDPDNVDGYQNDNGLNLTEADTVSFVKFLSEEAAQYNMSTGLKNAGGIIDKVIDYVHFSVNEQCIEYSECETFSKFIDADKPVFNIEYPSKAPKVSSSAKSTICATSGDAQGSNKFSKVIKKMILDGWVEYCGETETFTTDVDKS